jgi:hypothetical protein
MNCIPEIVVDSTIFTASSLAGFYLRNVTKKYNSGIDGAIFCGTGLAMIYSFAKCFSTKRYSIVNQEELNKNYYAFYLWASFFGGYALA